MATNEFCSASDNESISSFLFEKKPRTKPLYRVPRCWRQMSMDEKKIIKNSWNLKGLALGMAAYTGASIIGPLAIFLGSGFILDHVFDTKPLFMIIGLVVAFLITNFLIYKKIKKLIGMIDKVPEKDRKDEGNKSNNI